MIGDAPRRYTKVARLSRGAFFGYPDRKPSAQLAHAFRADTSTEKEELTTTEDNTDIHTQTDRTDIQRKKSSQLLSRVSIECGSSVPTIVRQLYREADECITDCLVFGHGIPPLPDVLGSLY